MWISGIYKIENTLNGNMYIGSSVSIKDRFHYHKSALRRNVHDNSHLQRAYNKYGEANFRFEVVLLCNHASLLSCEQLFIDYLQPVYNLSSIAGKVEMTEDVRSKISLAHKGKHRPYMIGTQHAKGHRWSEEEKVEIGKRSKGRIMSEYTRHKLSVSLLGNQHAKGWKMDEDTKRKISERMIGNKHSKGRPKGSKNKN